MDWRVVTGESTYCGTEEPYQALLLNLATRDIQFSIKATDERANQVASYSLPEQCFFMVACAACEIELEGSGALLVIDLESLPHLPDRSQQAIKAHPVPSAASSLVECLAKEYREIPRPSMIRALTELLSPSLLEEFAEDESSPFRNYIAQHLSEPISTEDVASALGMSTGQLREMTRDRLGLSPVNYLREVRIQYARDLLANTRIPIEQIAEQTGYSDRFSFSRAFTAVTGESPKAFRKAALDSKTERLAPE